MKKVNLVYKNIKDFVLGDSLYMTITESAGHPTQFLCEFIKLEKGVVHGKVVGSTVNHSMYTHRIKQGWEVKCRIDKCSLWGATADQKRDTTHWFDARGFAAYKTIEKLEDLIPKEHNSYGLISLSRGQSNNAQPLFGSSIKHRNTITLKLYRAEINRDLNRDSIFQKDQLIEVEMSESQFTQAITMFNNGEGTPVTIKRVADEGAMDPCPYVNKVEQFTKEFKQDMDEYKHSLDHELKQAKDILTSGKAPNKGEREIILNAMERIISKLTNNVPFVAKQFEAQMDQTVLEAKTEIESFMKKEAARLGIPMDGTNKPLEID